MPPEERLVRVAAGYPRRVPRASVAAVEELLASAGVEPPERTVVVVGTNGKTSVATYVERLLRARGWRVGATTSPHVRRWSERIRVDETEIDVARIADAVEDLDARVGDRSGLRFFDLLTLAALRIFREERVDAAVFEAGIGGRVDATAALRPTRVILTGVALDHTELLGDTLAAIRAEKLAVAAPGATIVEPDAEPGTFRERNARLARRAVQTFFGPHDSVLAGAGLDLDVPGRFQRGDGWVVDAAHNEDGWRTFVSELDPPFVAVVSIGADKSRETLAEVLRPAAAVVSTTAWEGRSLPAQELALGEVVPDPGAATRRGLELARARGATLAVFGTSHLVTHALDVLQRN